MQRWNFIGQFVRFVGKILTPLPYTGLTSVSQGSNQFISTQILQAASNARIRIANNSTNRLWQLD